MRTHGLVICIGILLAACGSKSTGGGTTPTVAAKDLAVQAGGGWTRSAPGEWLFAVDGDVAPDMALTAEENGQGMELIRLPAGAKQATLSQLMVAYTGTGDCTWTIHADVGGQPGDVLATLPVTVGSGDVGAIGQAPTWTTHAVSGVTVTAPVWLVFSVEIAGQPKVAAREGAATPDVTLLYRPSPDDSGQPVPHLAYVRVLLTSVE